MFSLSVEPEAYSPYLSPLIANNNSKDLDEEGELINFHLDEEEAEEEHSLQHEEEADLNLDLMLDHKSTPEDELMEESPTIQTT